MHGTAHDTTAAADTCSSFRFVGFRLIQKDQPIVLFLYGCINSRYRHSHHWAANENFCRFAFHTDKLQNVTDTRTNRYNYIFAVLYSGTINGKTLFNKRDTCFHVICQKSNAGYIHYNAAYISRQLAHRNRAVGTGFDQHFFSTLWVSCT